VGAVAENVSQVNVSVDQGAHVSVHRFTGNASWTGNLSTITWLFRTGADPSTTTDDNVGTSGDVDGSVSGFTFDKSLDSDITWTWRTRTSGYFVSTDSILTFKTYAVTATASTPTSSAIDTTIATITCNYFPNTNASTASVLLEYRQLGGSTWTTAGATDTGKTGYSELSISRDLTGLTPSTTYEFRLSMTRNTSNATTLTSAIATFTTSAATPTITTNAASNIGTGDATLNGTVNPNGLSTTYHFVWGTTNGGPYPNTTAAQGPSSSSSNIAYSQTISGLSTSTTYYYKAVATYSGTDYSGSQVSFTTEASAEEAPNVNNPSVYNRKYGTQSTLYFTVLVPSGTNSNRFFNAAVPWVAGDVLVVKDGGTPANIGTLPTRVGTSPLYTLTLTATEMQATDLQVLLVDQDGPAWRDTTLHVQTKDRLGQIDVDATAIGSSASAMSLTPASGGYGILASSGIAGLLKSHIIHNQATDVTAQGGGASTITLDAAASATNDFYNGCVIMTVSGTGRWQSRIITDYDGTTKVATVNRAWAINPVSGTGFFIAPGEDVWNIAPDGELSTLPSATSPFGKFLQFCFQRFAYKRTQTATEFTMYKADSSTELCSGLVSDDGTIESANKLS
jgi:hypothetical protein